MPDRHSLRGRLTLAYTLALVLALSLFAVFAVVTIDRAQRSALDAQLATSARAVLAIVDSRSGKIAPEETDAGKISRLLGGKADAAMWQADGALVLASEDAVLPSLRERALRAKLPLTESFSDGEEHMRALVGPVIASGVPVGAFAVWRDDEGIETLDRTVGIAFAVAIPVLGVLAVLLGSTIARRALMPLDRVAVLASEIEAHDLSARLRMPKRDDELGRFAAAFDRMLDRLERAFARERRFTSDASHELRAPLSVIRVEAEVALRSERSAEEYQRVLGTIISETDALEASTRDLLRIARAESDGAGDAPIDVGDLIADVVRRGRLLGSVRGVAVESVGQVHGCVRGSLTALTRALLAIVHNALKYAPEGGHVRVVVDYDEDRVAIAICDDGPGFSALALSRAFERFWRDDPRRDGSGLGLAIARAVVIAHGGTIGVENAVRGGGVVCLRLPLIAATRRTVERARV